MDATLDPRGDLAAGTVLAHRSNRAPLARSAAAGAGVLGLLGDALLREGPSGLGFLLFVAALLGTLAWLTRQRAVRWTLGATLLVVPVLWFAAAIAWRASGALGAFNFLALLTALSALSWALLRGEAWEPAAAGVGEYVGGAVRTGLSAGVGAILLLAEARVASSDVTAPSEERARRWPAVARGGAVALPIVIVFGSLFSAADPVFERLVKDVIDVDVSRILSHLALAAFVAWPAAGYLRASAVAPIDGNVSAARALQPPRLGVIEIGVALGALNALFLLFVVVQLRYLFGGEALVQTTAGVTYAEYARRGFFELVWVTALSLGVVLGANGLLRRDRPRDEIVFRALAWTLLALLAVVMLSAVQRMLLYQRAYGLTEPRFYATIAMVWLGVVLAWFAGTVLRGRGTPAFAFGALASAWLAVGVLDLASPDAIIARSNLARLDAGARFDATYVSTLGGDAVPTIAERLLSPPGSLTGEDRCALERAVHAWRQPTREDRWRTWNVARAQARAAARLPRLVASFPPDCVAARGS